MALSPVPFQTQLLSNGLLSNNWTNWLNELRNYIIQKINGSASSPISLSADVALTPSKNIPEQTHFIQGSAGAVDVSANPQIAKGTRVGQKLRLIGGSSTNTVKYDNGTGLVLESSYTMGDGSLLALFWNGSNWVEEYRNGV